jgi:regulator of replication initiation timing
VNAYYDRIEGIDQKIRLLRNTAEELMAMAGDIGAIKKNLIRLLASTRMLELNVSDVKEVLSEKKAEQP